MIRLEGRAGPSAPRPTAVTVGMFDGVHRGHQAVLGELAALGRPRGLDLAVVTFRAHPKAVTLGHAPPSITSFEHRLVLLERAGMDLALALDFDERLRRTSAEEFLREILHARLRASLLVLGWDSKFGRDREGTIGTILPLAAELGIEVRSIEPVQDGGRPVSSTAIREAISLGDLPAAREMLGRNPTLYGRVVAGARRGRALGFPTANLDLDHELRPPAGVYAVRVHLDGHWRPAVLNLGRRPTFETDAEPSCEVHLLDFEGDLYDRWLEVALIERLREERRFASAELLREAIAADVAAARVLLRDVAVRGES